MTLKHVFIVTKEVDYEGDRVYGIYTNQKLANAAAEQMSNGASVKMVPVNAAADVNFLYNN
jgi:hypothetical protein